MKTTIAALFLGVTLLPALARAQRTTCADSTPHFEFQVTTPARWIPDSSTVHPTARTRNPSDLVQFIVDTLGAPEPRTFKVLKTEDQTVVAEARRLAATWRFTPSVAKGCRVRQLVQTPVGR